jgi:hypothetical protein
VPGPSHTVVTVVESHRNIMSVLLSETGSVSDTEGTARSNSISDTDATSNGLPYQDVDLSDFLNASLSTLPAVGSPEAAHRNDVAVTKVSPGRHWPTHASGDK